MTERRKAVREQRRAARLCLQCAAGLQTSDVVLCVECAESRSAARARHELANPGRDRTAKKATRARRRHITNAAARADYLARKLSGRCTHKSCSEPQYRTSLVCKRHLRADRKSSREYWRRARAKQLSPFTVEVIAAFDRFTCVEQKP